MNKIKNVCIFASSSDYIDNEYFIHAEKLGILLGKSGYNIVYGGSELGLMGKITLKAKENGSEITGVMPERLRNLGINQGPCTKFIVTKGMRERKAKMDEISDAVIALPGGFGTLEELSEMIVQKQLGYNNKPIILLNTKNYYDNLICFFKEIIYSKFASKESDKLYYVAQIPDDAVNFLQNYNGENINYLKDKIKINL